MNTDLQNQAIAAYNFLEEQKRNKLAVEMNKIAAEYQKANLPVTWIPEKESFELEGEYFDSEYDHYINAEVLANYVEVPIHDLASYGRYLVEKEKRKQNAPKPTKTSYE